MNHSENLWFSKYWVSQTANQHLEIRRPRRGLQACVTLLVSSILFWEIVWSRFQLHPPPCTPISRVFAGSIYPPSTLALTPNSVKRHTKITKNYTFLQIWHVSKLQKCLFGKKTLREASKHKGAFQKIPPQNKFIFLITWKKVIFPKHAVIDWNLQVKIRKILKT